jgi:hypothetical protein
MRVLTEVNHTGAIQALVQRAEKLLILTTAYFDPWNLLEVEIQQAAQRGVNVLLLVRGDEQETKQYERARALERYKVKVGQLSRLHAKLYISERLAIVTSMNLVTASANGSWEVGALYSADEDAEGYKQLLSAAAQLLRRAELQHQQKQALATDAIAEAIFRPEPARSVRGGGAPKGSRNVAGAGSCITCATSIPVNLERPFCRPCYTAWSGAETARMSFCHTCGDRGSTSFQKPRCKTCWSQGLGEG